MKTSTKLTLKTARILWSAPLFAALQLVAEDLDPMLLGKWPPFARGPATAVAIQNGYAFLMLQGAGLAIIDVRNPASPRQVGGYDTSGWAVGMAVSGNYAYVAENRPWTGGYYLGSLQVIDVSDPANPQWVGGYDTSGEARAVAVSGNYAYVAGTPRWDLATHSYKGGGLEVVDVSDPANPQRVGSYDTSANAWRVAVSGNYAYLTGAERWTGSNYVSLFQVIDVSNPANPRRVGGYDISGDARDIGVSGNYVYLATAWGGLEMIDVSDAANPQRVGTYDPDGSVQGVSVSGNFAYVAGQRWTGSNYVGALQVVDVSNPANPQRMGGYDTSGELPDVAVSGNYAYVANGYSGLQVIDVSDPANPQRMGGYETGSIRNALDVAVSGNYAYVTESRRWTGSNYVSGLEVIDVSNPANPQRVSGYDTSGDAYRDDAYGVAVSGNYAYVAGIPHWTGSNYLGGLEVIDVSNPANPRRVGGYDTTGDPRAVAVSGDYAYVAERRGWTGSNYFGGLEVIDVSNPANPQRVGGYDTSGDAYGVAVSGNYAYVAGIPHWTGSNYLGGLEVIDVSNPANPRRVGGYDTRWVAWDVALSGNYAYVADGGGLQVIDVSNPANPQRVGGYDDTSGDVVGGYYNTRRVYRWARGVAVSGSYAYLTTQSENCSDTGCYVVDGRLAIIDVSDPANPQRVGGYDARRANGVAASGNYAYVADGDAGLQVIDVSKPANPQRMGGHHTSRFAYDVGVSDNFAYVTAGGSLQVIDASNPANPQRVGGYEISGGAGGVSVSGNYAYVTAGPRWTGNKYLGAGLEVIDVSNPANPQRVGGYETSDYAGVAAVAVSGNYAYVTAQRGTVGGSLQVIDVSDPANPQPVGGYDAGGEVRGVAVSGRYVFVAEHVLDCTLEDCWVVGGELHVIDISDPANPQRVGGYNTIGGASGVAVSRNYAYVADEYAGLQVIDVSNPANPRRVGGSYAGAQGVALGGNYAYVANGYSGLQVIDVSNPTNPQRVGGNSAFKAHAVAVANGKVFVAAGDQGLVILELFRPPNSCPSAQDQNVLTPEDTSLAITLGAERDADNEPALFATSQLPVYGAMTLAGNIAVYTPAPNYFGPDSFRFTVTDGHADCAPREYTVNISVECVNDPPVAEVNLALEECMLRFPGQAEPIIISLNGSDAPVGLNATATDLQPDCDELGENLTYSWMDENGAVLGNTPTLAGRFGLGCHSANLVVSDGTDRTTALTNFCVITAGEALGGCVALVDSANIGTQNKRPLIATLKAAMASFDRGNYSAGAVQLRAFQNKVQAQVAPHHPEAARLFLAWIEDLLNATACMASLGSNLDQ